MCISLPPQKKQFIRAGREPLSRRDGRARGGLLVRPVFSEQPHWTPQGVHYPRAFLLFPFHPIFFRGGKRQPEQIGSTSQLASAHLHSKNGPLSQIWRSITGTRKPSHNPVAKSRRAGIALDLVFDRSRNRNLQKRLR